MSEKEDDPGPDYHPHLVHKLSTELYLTRIGPDNYTEWSIHSDDAIMFIDRPACRAQIADLMTWYTR